MDDAAYEPRPTTTLPAWGSRPSQLHPYWCRTGEAAENRGISRIRVQQLATEGRLPFAEHHGYRLYRRSQLEVIANARDARRLAGGS